MMSVVMLMGRRADFSSATIFEIFVARVGAAHGAENARRTGLHGQVNVIAELRRRVDRFDDVAAEIARMRGGEAHAANARDSRGRDEQFGETHAARRGIAIGIYGLAEELNFGEAGVRKLADFFEHVRRWRGCAPGRA